MKKSTAILFLAIVFGLWCPVYSGDTDSPGPPANGSGMPTLEDLYDYINTTAQDFEFL